MIRFRCGTAGPLRRYPPGWQIFDSKERGFKKYLHLDSRLGKIRIRRKGGGPMSKQTSEVPER